METTVGTSLEVTRSIKCFSKYKYPQQSFGLRRLAQLRFSVDDVVAFPFTEAKSVNNSALLTYVAVNFGLRLYI